MQDPSSLSNPDEAQIKHLDWVATVDFSECTLHATATYDVELSSSEVSVLKLDTKYLVVSSVTVNKQNVSDYTISPLDEEKEHLGQCLTIPLSIPQADSNQLKTLKVSIAYQTTAKSSALQWLPPSQTAGKVYPYLFTQCQAIHARSLLPCQDCPGVKMTYTAQITTPSWATCVMSALSQTPDLKQKEEGKKNTNTFYFKQPVPISSYLLALAVGELSSHTISPRVQIWSEPSLLSACAAEFENTETFLQIAESLTFDYVWGRYDLLCLPPSFPYGGMENPCLTFITPTLLAGDQSLVDVVAHEIAHSWTGNLVTNQTWEHFWLNEGWTVWLERKIMARMKKDDAYLDFGAIGGWKALKNSIDLLPPDFSRLIPKLGDNDPDDAFSRVPYEKGFNLLYSLEQKVGSEAFEAFAKAYLHKFKYKTVTSFEFRDFFKEHFKDNEKIQDFDWESWLHAPGMPPETPVFDQRLASEAIHLADLWMKYDVDTTNDTSSISSVSVEKWSTSQMTCFLDSLITQCETRKKPLDVDTITALNKQYGMANSRNSEILSRVCELAIKAG